MTEQEWLAGTNPRALVRFVVDKASDRKLRLYGCACVRTVWLHLSDARSRVAVEVAERLADGEVKQEDVTTAREAAYIAAYGKRTWATWSVLSLLGDAMLEGDRCARRDDRCAILRDIFGNPFRRSAVGDPALVRWNNGTVVNLAQAIYDDRRFEELPILADALEEAGCTDADVLGHCRSKGPHVRGCWVVDLILGKQ